MNTLQQEAYIVRNASFAKMNFIQRVLGVLVSPSKTMDDLCVKPRVLFPATLMAFSPLLLIGLRFPLYKEFIRRSVEMSAQIQAEMFNMQMTAEQIEQSVSIQSIVGLVSTPISSVIGWVIGTAILFGIIKIFGGQGKFKQYLSITGYAGVITLFNYILITLVSFVTNNIYLDIPLTSIANVLPQEMEGSFIFGLIKCIDLFSIWGMAVTAIGAAIVSKLSKAKIYSIAAALYLVQMMFAGFAEAAKGMFS